MTAEILASWFDLHPGPQPCALLLQLMSQALTHIGMESGCCQPGSRGIIKTSLLPDQYVSLLWSLTHPHIPLRRIRTKKRI